MNTRTKSAKGSVDVLFMVDPKRLSIKVCHISHSKDRTEYATTFENFSYERVKIKPEVPDQLGQLPTCIDGQFYFRTEEEAHEFIRRQIGR